MQPKDGLDMERNYQMRLSSKLGIALGILVFATSAFASTVTFSYTGVGVNVTGTLGGTLNGGIFTATSGSGFYNLTPMTLVAASLSPNFGYQWDNQVYFPPVAGNSVNSNGLLFDVAGLGHANLCATTGCANDSNTGYTNLTNFAGNTPVEATFNSPTPEPSSLLTLGSGLIGLAGLARKRLLI
jgi:hypothetical protein